MSPTLATVLGIVSAFFGLLSITFVVVTFAINRKKDMTNDIKTANNASNETNQTLLELKLTLNQVNQNTIETKNEVKEIKKQIGEHTTELAIMRRDINQAQEDIEELKKTKMDK